MHDGEHWYWVSINALLLAAAPSYLAIVVYFIKFLNHEMVFEWNNWFDL